MIKSNAKTYINLYVLLCSELPLVLHLKCPTVKLNTRESANNTSCWPETFHVNLFMPELVTASKSITHSYASLMVWKIQSKQKFVILGTDFKRLPKERTVNEVYLNSALIWVSCFIINHKIYFDF